MQTLTSRIVRADPYHKRIVRGMVLVAAFVLIGKLAGAAKEMAVASRYGISEVVDGYLFVFNLVTLPVNIWFSVLTVVLLPLAARMRSDPAQLHRFRTQLLGLTLALGFGLGIAAWVGIPSLLRSGWAGLSADARNAALTASGPLALLAPMGVLVGLLSAWLLSREQHANTLIEGIPAMTILATLVLIPATTIQPLLWGTVAGFGLQLLILAVLQGKHAFEIPSLKRTAPQWESFWSGFGVMVLAQSIMSVTAIIDQFFAARLGSGAIATLGYANRIIFLILGLGATAISRATLPVFSQAGAGGEGSTTRRLALRWTVVMIAASVPVLLVAWILAPWGVNLLFHRGAFTSENVTTVSSLFQILLLQVPSYFAGLVLVSWINSQSRYVLLLIAAVAGFVIKLGGTAILVHHYGINGIALGTALMYLLTTAILLTVLVRREA